ncbi:MAG: hypothetical protein RLZZ618_3182 [Pseudomonadota bacterium]|jgi:hypothetical protein
MSSSPLRSTSKAAPLEVRSSEIRLDGTKIPTLNDNLVLVRLGADSAKSNGSPAKLSTSERASAMLMKAGKALSKPGIRRETVFGGGSGRGINAYSVYPADPTKIVRESADGQRTIGRLVGGRFRAIPVKP